MIADFALLFSLPGFQAATLIVERSAASTGTDYRGRPEGVTVTVTEVPIYMATHQATRKQLRRDQLDHASDFRAFYSSARLYTAGDGQRPDVVQYGGERWELYEVADYAAVGNLYMAKGQRIE